MGPVTYTGLEEHGDVKDTDPTSLIKPPESNPRSKDLSDWDRSTDCKTAIYDLSSQSYHRPSPVPRLNISELVPSKKLATGKLNLSGMEKRGNLASVDVLQGSPLCRMKDGKNKQVIEGLVGMFKTRVHRAFDLVFLSRVPKTHPADQSLTFEFSREEESLLASGALTGTFRQQDRLCNLSAIAPKESKYTEESLLFDYDDRVEVGSTVKTAFRILHSRLEKLISRRILRGFYRIAGV